MWILAWAFSPKVEFIQRFSKTKCLHKKGQKKKHYKHKSNMLTCSKNQECIMYVLNVYGNRS